jgi:hypothetical protein
MGPTVHRRQEIYGVCVSSCWVIFLTKVKIHTYVIRHKRFAVVLFVYRTNKTVNKREERTR